MSEPPYPNDQPDDPRPEGQRPSPHSPYGRPGQHGQNQSGQPDPSGPPAGQYGQSGQYPQPGRYGPPAGQYGQSGQYPQPGRYGSPTGQYGQPTEQYPQQGQPSGDPYYSQQPPSLPGPAGPPAGVTISLGARAWRRPEPRVGVTLAGAGAALVLIGLLIWAGGYFAKGVHVNFDFDSDNPSPSTSGDGRRFLGAALFFVLVLVGYAAMITRRRGPIATAGAVIGGLSVPLTIGFLTLSIADTFAGSLPVNIDAIYLVSILVWLVSYLLVPGARGRAFFLGAAALGLASYVVFKVAGNDAFRAGLSITSGGGGGSSDDGSTSVAVVGIIFGLVYYAIAAALDRAGRSGAATGLVVAGFFAATGGIGGGAGSLGQAGTGVALLLIGLLLTGYGSYFGRRFTGWVWAFGALGGIVLIVVKITQQYAGIGVTLLVLGFVIVGLGVAVTSALNESPDIDDDAPVPAARPQPAPPAPTGAPGSW